MLPRLNPQKLFVAEQTVGTHAGRILRKPDLRDRVQAVAYAYETGVVRRAGSGSRVGKTSVTSPTAP